MSRAVQFKPPTLLKFRTESFFGGRKSLHWEGSKLWQFRSDPWFSGAPDGIWEALVPPSREQWLELQRQVDEADAWHWPTEGADLLVLDGERWSLTLHWGRQRWSGGGYETRPFGFESIEHWLQGLMNSSRIPGIPHPFHVIDEGSESTWEFRWDGRTLTWTRQSVAGTVHIQGTLEDPSPNIWSEFVKAFRPTGPIELKFRHGAFAGIAINAFAPLAAEDETGRGLSVSSFVDPLATVMTLKALVRDHPIGP